MNEEIRRTLLGDQLLSVCNSNKLVTEQQLQQRMRLFPHISPSNFMKLCKLSSTISTEPKWLNLQSKRIVQIGCGAIGSCMLPLYERHFVFSPKSIIVFDMREQAIASQRKQYPNIQFIHQKITKQNYNTILSQYLRPGDILLDLAWYIDTLELLTWCHERDILYLNTAVETWLEDDCSPDDKECQTLYHRQLVIRSVTDDWDKNSVTGILTHGANPGWVSHATKIGMRDWVQYLLKRDPQNETLRAAQQAADEKNWPKVAQLLNVQVIHIAERDTQISNIPKQVDEFVNTWSPMGFIEEGTAPAELGWGTHETLKTNVNHHKEGPKNQVYFDSMGMNTLVKSWVPSGDIVGMVVRHEEAFSISEYLTVFDGKNRAVYRPTVHYCYFSCPDSIASLYEMQSNGYAPPKKERVLKDEIISGKDELGVFMLSNKYGGWWIGSILDNDTAKSLLPHQSATVTQVASSVLSALMYLLAHPKEGIIHPDHMDPDEAMKYIYPYLGKFVSFYKEWTPTRIPQQYQDHPDWVIQKLLVK